MPDNIHEMKGCKGYRVHVPHAVVLRSGKATSSHFTGRYNFAKDIKIQFENSNPAKPKFECRSWRRILADDRLDLDCWGTTVPARSGSPCFTVINVLHRDCPAVIPP
eukprot:gene12065-biopygen6320